jgi:two-component system, response regulator
MNNVIKIALVEDNKNDQVLALRALQKAGVSNKTTVLDDGVEAIEFFIGDDANPPIADFSASYLILLDLKLPRLDGLEVLRRLRAHPRWKMAQIVILTASLEERDRIAGYGLGANSYILKPVDFDQFSEVIRQVGYYWLILNKPPPANQAPAPEPALAEVQ